MFLTLEKVSSAEKLETVEVEQFRVRKSVGDTDFAEVRSKIQFICCSRKNKQKGAKKAQTRFQYFLCPGEKISLF